MNSHLAIKINGRYIALAPDTSIDIEDSNPFFNDIEETWSYSFSVPIEGNRETFGNVDIIESDSRLADIEDLPMSVEIDGISYRNGRVRASEDQEIRGKIDISMSSSVKSLSEYFKDMNCRDIPVKDEIQIGEMLGDFSLNYSCNMILSVINMIRYRWESKYTSEEKRYWRNLSNVVSQISSFPALGFSRPDICEEGTKENGYVSTGGVGREPKIIEESFINITEPYPTKKYCNARISYLHHKKNADGTSSDEVDTESGKDNSKKYNPYFVLDANRPASGICFYVLYFLDCLFDSIKNDGVYYDNSELVKIQDMCRLAFYTTHCRFDVKRKHDGSADFTDAIDVSIDTKKKVKLDKINKWLSTHNIDTTLEFELKKAETAIEGSVVIDGEEYKKGIYFDRDDGDIEGYVESIKYKVDKLQINSVQANILKMYANEQNFPDTDVMSIIEGLWSAFGIRFFIDQEQRTVKPVFIRDVLRAPTMPEDLYGTVSDIMRVNEKITGVRMKYGAESDSQQQKNNIKYGVTNYDTSFDYIDYRNINSSLQYSDILQLVHDSNMDLYVDRSTGNKYRIKIDGDVENRKEFHPVLFEVGQYKSVEIGDCSKDNEDYVEEITVGFDPVLFNDVNGRNAKTAYTGDRSAYMVDNNGMDVFVSLVSSSDKQQVLSGFISDDMWHEDVPREIIYPMGSSHVDLSLKAKITTKEAFDPSSSDTGDSPLQSYDWGTSIAIMRGGGSDATIEYYDHDYDGFGSAKWRTIAGQYTMSSDSIDAWGSVYDYNGVEPGIGNDNGRFSLKIRAYINDPETGEPLCDSRVANRGLFDTFMSEYAHFLLNRKVVRLKYHGNITDLIGIKWDKRYTIGGYTGWINKISTHITAENGIEECTIEMYIL